MAKARERLMQLGLAQREAEEVASDTAKSALPTGGEFASTKVGRPSEAKDIEAETTPLIDFGEYFLNNLGITSPRQVRASIQRSAAIHEANTTMLQAAKEKLTIVSQQVGGIDTERMQRIVSGLDEAATLMDNQVPEIQEFGRERLQSAVADLDAMQNEHAEFLGQERNRLQGQIDSVVELGRAEERESATIIGVLNERGSRDGMTSNLSVTEKQVLAEYLGGSNFAQKIGADGIVPSISIPFDPSEQISVGDASALVQAAKKNRRLTLADQLGDINGTAVGAGFKIADEDGKLTVHEITSPPLAQEIAEVRYKTPAGQPLNIKPGLPSSEDTRRTIGNLGERIQGAVQGISDATGRPAFGREVDIARNLWKSFVDRATEASNKPVARETN